MLRVKHFFAFVFLVVPCMLLAAEVHINPVRLKFEPGQTIDSFKVVNAGKDPVLFQLKAFKWTQEEGKDVYTDTKDIILNPPIANIAEESYQLVRVGLRAPLNPKIEHTYRVIATQVPSKNKTDSFQVETLIRFSIPVFIEPKNKIDDLSIDTKSLPNGDLELHIKNAGNRHIQITNIDFYQGEEKPLETTVTKDKFVYLLPEQSKVWPLKWKEVKGAKEVVVKLQTDRGPIEKPVVVTAL
jgi:fimbrial chaperone protein